MEGYLGTIMMCGFNFAPMSWGYCNGASVPVAQNQALYSLLGPQFGGNGSTNFNLPDLQGRAPVHFGTASGGVTNRAFAAKFGQESVTLAQAQMPAHTHAIAEVQAGKTVTMGTPVVTVNASDAPADALKPTLNYWAKTAVSSTISPSYHNAHNVTMASDAVQVSVSAAFSPSNLATSAAGGAASLSLATPALGLNFVICMSGMYPTRD